MRDDDKKPLIINEGIETTGQLWYNYIEINKLS